MRDSTLVSVSSVATALPREMGYGGLRSQVVYSKQPKLGLTQEFGVGEMGVVDKY